MTTPVHNQSADAAATALVVLNVNHVTASSDSRFVSRLRASGCDTTYFERRVQREIVPNINALSRSVRSENGSVIWIRPEWRTETLADWPTSTRSNLAAQGFDTPSHDGLHNFSLLDGLDVETGDHDLTTFSPSAFWGSPLLATLRNLGIVDVLIAGCFTESAVVINAMDSTNTGFFTTVIEDACTSISAERHEESMALHSRLFKVANTRDVIARLSGK